MNPSNININPFDYPEVECSSCKNKTFVPAIMFRQIPGVMVGRGDQKTVDFPLKVFICSKCGALSPTDQEILTEKEKTDKQEKPKSNLIID